MNVHDSDNFAAIHILNPQPEEATCPVHGPVGDKVIDQRTGQMMTCVTCHDPMGSPNRYHLVLSAKKELCTQCHRSY